MHPAAETTPKLSFSAYFSTFVFSQLCTVSNNYIMKRINIIYWIVTILFSAFMLFSAYPDIIETPEAMTFITSLGYPGYFVKFIGIAKLLGIIAILVPGYPRIKEWAYAGLFYDLFGATYSLIAQNGVQPQMAFMLLPFTLLFLSYWLYHKRAELQHQPHVA
jgi:hypothetical protein